MKSKSVIKREQQPIDFIESNYYKQIVLGWNKAYKKVNGNISRITKKMLMEQSGLHNHQRFDRHFPTLEDFYKATYLKVCFRMSKVAYAYDHQGLTGAEFWKFFLDELQNCKGECRIALRRGDFLFFRIALSELEQNLSEITFGVDPGTHAYEICLKSPFAQCW